MDSFTRAFCYIRRKRMKSLLLLLLFLVINSMVLGTLGIRATSLRLAEELRRNAESKVTLESLDLEMTFNDEDCRDMISVNNVNRINRLSETQTISCSLFPVPGNEESDDVLYIHGYDEPDKDSPFTDKIYRIIEGDYPHRDDEIVINQFLAERNGIQLNDEVTFETADGRTKEVAVSGLFLSGTERNQTEKVATANLIENQIYGMTGFVKELSGKDSYVNAVVYVNDPEYLEDTERELRSMYQNRAVIRTLDNTFQKLKLMIGQVERVTFLIFALTVIVGSSVAGLLLAMWMRNRKTEIAVLISLGISKLNILEQMLLEDVLLYGISFAGAFVAAKTVLPEVVRSLDILQESDIALGLSSGGMAIVLCAGMVSVMVLTGIAIFPLMKKPIKDILSEMEE